MLNEELKNYKFYRISTDINNKIYLEFIDNLGRSIKLKHNVIKNKGLSIYSNTTLYDLFCFNNNNDIIKYIK